MEKGFIGVVSQLLEQAAQVIGLETGSVMLWGEVEVPECLRAEAQEDER